MAQCAIERQKGNSKTMHGMPRKIQGCACQDSSGVGLFLSAEGALHWAYAVSARPIVNISMINRMREEPVPVCANALLVNLTAQDRHGQAALIIGLIDKLHDPVGREYIKARFGRKTDPSDLLCLVEYCADGLRVPEKQEAVYRVLKDYFTGRMSIRTVRREIGCRHHSAAVVRHRLFTALDVVEKGLQLPSSAEKRLE